MASPSFTDTILHDTLFLDDVILSYADKTPNKRALTFNGKNISYADLSASVALLAQQLLHLGIAPGDFVTVLLPSSESITTALLAIIRIGAIYAPLDPEHPESQLTARYHAINAKCTITTSELQERFNGWAPITIAIDVKAPEIDNALPLPTRDINQPACIFFTSGTTGEAKGVLGSARAMRDSILGPAQDLHFTHTDTLNSIARYAWSISMLELLAPLVAGGTSLILERQHALDLTWLKKQAEACTAFHCPPALLRSLANFIERNYSAAEYLSHVRLAWYGGDAFSPENITQLHTVFPNALVGTAYGCTEIFGLSHIHYYQRDTAINKVLIGKPVTGINQRILDDYAQEAGVHQEGEILLGGNRVALEYWKNPELNAEKFSVINGVRHFKTGDYACPDQTGALEFLQRKDSQVKIRGIRVELGEIEHQLLQINNVQEAIVLAVETALDEKELRAYLTCDNQNTIEVQQLQSLLCNKLPDYMVPAKFHLLDTFPVTENFKVDRKKLAELKYVAVQSENSGHGIADIWAEVTGQKPNSHDDNFFNLGGNSLLAMQLAVEINKQLDITFEVADVYRNPTLGAQLALQESQTKQTEEESHYNGPEESNTHEPVFATQGQVGLFFRELLDRKGASITCTRYIRSQAPYQESVVREAIVTLINRHPTLKTNVKISRPNIELIENSFHAVDIEYIRKAEDWSLEAGAEQPLSKHTHKFDLKNKPLLCAIVNPMLDGSEILQLTAHHIGADDNSMGRLAKEFTIIYDALLKKKEYELPKLHQPYSEYAQGQFEKISQGYYNSDASKLAQRLHDLLPICLEKPLLNLDGWNNKDSAHTQQLLPSNIDNLAFTDYIAAFSWALHQTSGRESFVFCAHVALRRDTESAPVIGMYVNLLPVLTGVNPSHTYAEHTLRTAADFNEAMSRSDIPYELVLSANDALKKLRKYPFDAFINELAFAEEFIDGYENMIVPTHFATDGSEINMSIMQANENRLVHLEGPMASEANAYQPLALENMLKFLHLEKK